MNKLIHLSFFCVAAAQAAVVVDITQIGSDVVISHSGTIDTASASNTGFLADQGVTIGKFGPNTNYITFGEVGRADAYSVSFSEFPFAMLTSGTAFPDSRTGDTFGIYRGENRLYLPVGYVTGETITGGATFNGKTLADLGIVEGTYTATFSNAGTTENVTYNVSVPETSQFALIASLISLGFCYFKRRR